MTDIGLIELAHAPDFRLGRVEVRPARRQIVAPSGESEVLQPRVMQVLVALSRADGAIVTRDELTQACWDGRVVGEDAINRVISQLRRSAERVGAGSFSIETITKVGYRLQDGLVAADDARPAAGAVRLTATPWGQPAAPSRRRALVLAATGAGALAAAAAGGLWWRRWAADQPPSPQAAALLEQAMQSLQQGTRDSQYQAIGLLQKAVADWPAYADGWGALGFAYAYTAHWRAVDVAEPLRQRARHAIMQAKALSADNVYAEVAAATLPPTRGAWWAAERALRAAFHEHPNTYELLSALAEVLCQTGRHADAAAIYDTVRRHSTAASCIYYGEILALWGANRLEEADRLLDEATNLYPTQFALWFGRVYILMYSGRAQAAIGLLQDTAGRPSGIPTAEFDKVAAVAEAFVSRDPKAIDHIMQVEIARARTGAGYAENTIQFASALGRVDDAFATAAAYYFSERYVVPQVRFTPEQGSYTPIGERGSAFLFYPSTAAMRADPRFGALVDRLGLTAYWRASGSQPDDR